MEASVTGPHLLRATLAAIARLEAAGDKPARLTEPDFAQWARFRRKLGWADFIRLLHEDAAESFPEPFDVARWGIDPFAGLEEGTAQMLVGDAARPSGAEGVEFLAEQARGLELAAGGAISELGRVQAREKVLELGAGRIAAYHCARHADLAYDRNFVFVFASPAERVLIGLGAVERRSNVPTLVHADALPEHLEGARYDRIYGIEGSELHGAYGEAFEGADAEVRWA